MAYSNLPYGFKRTTNAPVDGYFNDLTTGDHYLSVADANAKIPSTIRYSGQLVHVNNDLYYYRSGIADTDLKLLIDGSIAPNTLLGRYSATSGTMQPITLGSGFNLDTATGILTTTDAGGTVTSVSVVSNQGVSGSVANPTTTPAITLSLGALTGITSAAITGALSAGGTVTFGGLAGVGDRLTYVNSLGAFSPVSLGSGLAFSGGVLSATGGAPGTVTYSGTTTAGYLPIWTSVSDLTNSIISVAGTVVNIPGSITGVTSYNGLVVTANTGVITTGTWNGTAIANNYLANSSITINGSSVSLGGSVTVTATASNALTIGTDLSGTSYNGSTPVTINNTSTLSSVTGRGNTSSSGISLTENGNLSSSYALYMKRNTDTSPLGYFIQAQNNAANANLFTVDVTGAVTALSFAGSGASLTSIPNGALVNSSITINGSSVSLGGSVTVTATASNALTMNNSGTGDASGTTYNGSAARTISYNTIGASPLAGSTSLVTVGTITTGVWNGTAIANNYLANSSITINGSSVSLGGSITVTATASNALTIGTDLSGTSYNGSTPVTINNTSTLATVTGRGATTSTQLTLNGGIIIPNNIDILFKNAAGTGNAFDIYADPSNNYQFRSLAGGSFYFTNAVNITGGVSATTGTFSGGLTANMSTTNTPALTINRSTTSNNGIIKFQTGVSDTWILGNRNTGDESFRLYNYNVGSDTWVQDNSGNNTFSGSLTAGAISGTLFTSSVLSGNNIRMTRSGAINADWAFSHSDAGGNGYLYLVNQSTSANVLVMKDDGAVGFGSSTPYSLTNYRFISTSAATGGGIVLQKANVNKGILYSFNDNVEIDALGSMYFATGGVLGSGTTALTIASTQAFTFNTSATVAGSFQSSGTTPYWQYQSTGASATGYLGFGASLISGAAATDFILRSDNAFKLAIGNSAVLTVSGSTSTFSGEAQSTVGFYANKAPSNTAGGAGYVEFGYTPNNRFSLLQQNTSYNIDFWHYNGSSWSVGQTFGATGGITCAGLVSWSGSDDISNMPTAQRILGAYTSSSASGASVVGIFRGNQTAATTGSIQGVEGYVKNSHTSGTVTLGLGVVGNGEVSGAGGTTTWMRSVQGGGLISAGTVTNWAKFYAAAVTNTGGTITNQYSFYGESGAGGLYVADNSTFGGTLTASGGGFDSDLALKEIITRDISNRRIADQVSVIKYKWKDITKGIGEKFGYGAQELLNLIPEAVYKNGDTYAVDYCMVHTILIDENTKRIQALEKEVKYLKDKLTAA